MAMQKNLHSPDELLQRLQAKAQSAGKTADKPTGGTLLSRIEARPWQDLLAYGLERGRAAGYTEDDVSRVVRENRQRHR